MGRIHLIFYNALTFLHPFSSGYRQSKHLAITTFTFTTQIHPSHLPAFLSLFLHNTAP